MKLTHLTDSILLNDTKFLVKKEHEITTRLLHHLKEIERRRLFSDLGYSSLFAYATKELGYSESSAYRRIQGARLLKDLPEVETQIEKGTLTLTNIAQASQFFKQNNISSPEEKKDVLKKIAKTSKRECEKALFALREKTSAPAKESVRRNSATTQELKVTLNDGTLKKLEELKNLLAHEGERTMEELLNLMLDQTIAQARKKKFHLGAKEKKTLAPAKVERRAASAALKRKIYLRDQGKCQKCQGSYKVQIDHHIPFALGGKTSEENLRLLCFSCNQRQRIKAKL